MLSRNWIHGRQAPSWPTCLTLWMIHSHPFLRLPCVSSFPFMTPLFISYPVVHILIDHHSLAYYLNSLPSSLRQGAFELAIELFKLFCMDNKYICSRAVCSNHVGYELSFMLLMKSLHSFFAFILSMGLWNFVGPTKRLW